MDESFKECALKSDEKRTGTPLRRQIYSKPGGSPCAGSCFSGKWRMVKRKKEHIVNKKRRKLVIKPHSIPSWFDQRAGRRTTGHPIDSAETCWSLLCDKL